MRQHITVEQLNELSDKAKRKWSSFMGLQWQKELNSCNRKNKKYKVLCKVRGIEDLCASIGQLIEFLKDCDRSGFYKISISPKGNFDGLSYFNYKFDEFDKEWQTEHLCDSLWEAVKEVLEK